MRKPRLPATLNRWEHKRDCAGSKTQGRCASWRGPGVGMSSAGMRRLGLPEHAFMARRRDSSCGGRAWRCWPVHRDARIRHALRRSVGGRLSPARAAGPEFFAPIRGITCGQRFRQHGARPIDPPAAARLSLGQAGEFIKCLLCGDLYCCTVTADGHRYPVTSPSRPACCRPCELQR